jgi:GNAT superfamily N-acetyltransferase
MVSIALGGTGEPHRVVYVFTLAPHRNQGRIRALMTQLLADLDAEAAECIIIIRNVEPGCDIPRLTTFFESLGYVQETPDPPTLRRLPQPAS